MLGVDEFVITTRAEIVDIVGEEEVIRSMAGKENNLSATSRKISDNFGTNA